MPPALTTTPTPPPEKGTFSQGAGGGRRADWTPLRVVVETAGSRKKDRVGLGLLLPATATTTTPTTKYPPTTRQRTAAHTAWPAPTLTPPSRPPLSSHRTHSHLSFNPKMARLFVTVTSFVAACATVDAFQVPRMSLDKYRSELAETAKKIASPGTFLGGG